jgi:Bacteriophage lambda head decoration protein D
MAGLLGATETEGTELSQLVASDVHEQKPITIISGAGVLERGAVLGLISKALGTVLGSGNTGNGIVEPVSLGFNAQIGCYFLGCIAAAADGGTFVVHQPDGTPLGEAEVGTPFNSGHINFTIADGTVDFIVGDAFIIPVEIGSLKYEELDPAGVTGIQQARAILGEDVDASTEDVAAEGFFTGKYRLSDLRWPTAITDDQKNTAILELQDRGILVDEDFV